MFKGFPDTATEAKRIELEDTIWLNRGCFLFKEIIRDCLKKDYVESKMRSLRADSMYKKRAAEYYAKHGTVGEF